MQNYGFIVLVSGALAAWRIYDIATAVEAPSTALLTLQYVVLALLVISCVGSAALYLKNK